MASNLNQGSGMVCDQGSGMVCDQGSGMVCDWLVIKPRGNRPSRESLWL